MASVLVTDGNQRATLAVVRSLGRLGLNVTVAEDRLPCLAAQSKYCSASLRLPSLSSAPMAYLEALAAETAGSRHDLVIPMTDMTAYLVARFRDRFPSHSRVPLADWPVFEQAIDKGSLIHLAENLEVPAPMTFFPETPQEATTLIRQMKFPVVIKPRQSKYLTETGWLSTSVVYAHTKDEIEDYFHRWNPQLPFPMIQERIEGAGCGAFFLFEHGEEKAVFFHKRLREKPPSGGVSVLRESLPVNAEMREYAGRLLRRLNWHGVAMVEFKVDQRDGQPKLMEINPRFWGSLQLAIDAGVDFPRLLYTMESSGTVDHVPQYSAGVRSRWFLGDLDHLYMRLLKSNRSLNLPAGAPGRLATLWEFLKLVQANTRYEVIDRRDIRPFLFELKVYLRDIIHALARRFALGKQL